jgi:galacturan 1,4-alpha-galacturonidase
MFEKIHLFVSYSSFSPGFRKHSLVRRPRTLGKYPENLRREARIRRGTSVPGASLYAECDENMTQNEHHAMPVRIAYIGGGSLNWAPVLMGDLAADPRLAAEVRLYDPDHAAAERNARLGARFAEVAVGRPAKWRAVRDLGDALDGADLVVVSILPGSLEDMAADIGIPARYGIPQAVGDTVGPGGFVRALRAVPMMLQIGRAIRTHAPDAFVCNLTNPMSVLTDALHRAHPGIRAWGECHEVTKLRRQVAWIANQEAGGAQHGFRDVAVNVVGINHFTFATGIRLDGRDMMADWAEFARAHADRGWHEAVPDSDDEHARYFSSRSRVKFDLHRRFGLAPAAGDRHLAEFLPAQEYLDDAAGWGFALTPVDYRKRDRAARRARAEAMIEGRIIPAAKRSDEAMLDQFAALMGAAPHVSNVNLPNRGQIAGLPQGTVVETNARFTQDGIEAIPAGAIPGPLAGIVADHAARQRALVDAVVGDDYGALFPLFASDPLVRPLPEAKARAMFAEMLQATARWLPDALVAEAA